MPYAGSDAQYSDKDVAKGGTFTSVFLRRKTEPWGIPIKLKFARLFCIIPSIYHADIDISYYCLGLP